ncbi:hypothetical protein [Marivita hallyeonensis]|uniref:Uncharacterized protein n=1 Tax=Marivita hallyeonensis TaxID=996342 RepID=A0A1M5XUC7_9RHOB|nr:hypothetical protein [Marivita hallyeonensis]SHI03425.1 hypothetical protein SAMN05443551_4154 [Marivita hallyeonensis]
MKKLDAPAKDSEPLFVQKVEKLPLPLDRHIASLKLWSDANTADGGYKLFLSANVGSDVITLDADGTPIDVVLEIYQAEVDLFFPGSRVSVSDTYRELFGVDVKSAEVEETEAFESSGSASLRPGSSGLDAKTSKKTTRSKKLVEDDGLSFRHPALEMVCFGKWSEKKALEGNQVPNYNGWEVFHANGKDPSGVLARFNVRKNWIGFKDVEADQSTRLGRLINDTLGKKSRVDQERARLFTLLLKELAYLGLQNRQEKSIATLAAAAIQVDPQTNEHFSVPAADRRKNLSVPSQLLTRFLTSTEEQLQAAYKSAISDAEQLAKLNEKGFVPKSNFLEAQAAYLKISLMIDAPQLLRKDLESEFGANVIKDLSNLGLLTRGPKGTVRLVEPMAGTEIGVAFQTLVKRQPTIQKVDSWLVENPNISPLEIGQRLAEYLWKDWSDTSAKRNGHQIRSWARLQGHDRKGRRPSISPETLPIIREYAAQGMSVLQIAEAIGVHQFTVERALQDERQRELQETFEQNNELD